MVERATARVFFQTVGIDYLVVRDAEVKRLREENAALSENWKKVKSIGAEYHEDRNMVCPSCCLILRPAEEPRYCLTCNIGLPCITWMNEEHGAEESARQCIECEAWSCALCFNDETEECGECNKKER